ncbi:MAG: type VII toxin-antitoxin system HepT family RNase toxin, partial [Planktothrix sp.]
SERLIQLLVEAATDISSYLLVELHQVTPSTYVDSFILAGQNGIITQDLAATLSKSGGMRNRLVHNYDEIKPKIVFSAISRALEEYPIYIRQVNNYLDSLEVNNG